MGRWPLAAWILQLYAQDAEELVDFSTEFPGFLTEEVTRNVIFGDFVLEAELGLETNFEDIDRVLRGTLGQICQHSPVRNAPVEVKRFLDMESLVKRRKAFRYTWWLLPLQSHPLPGDCMSTLAQMSYGPTAPPFEEIGKKEPPMRHIFAVELASYTSTSAMEPSGWGLTLQNVSCLPLQVKRAIMDDEGVVSTTPLPTHICDGRLYATGLAEDTGFEPNQVSDCSMAGEDPCLCVALTDCEWQPGSGEFPGGCAATKNPGVSCQACPFQDKCGTPVLETIAPVAGTLLGELGVWELQVLFDRTIELNVEAQADDSGVLLKCDVWEDSGGSSFRLSKWKVSVQDSILTIDLKHIVNYKRRTCFLTLAANILRSVETKLPYPGMIMGQYFIFLPDTEKPTVSSYSPPNSVRKLDTELQVSLKFTEAVFWGREASARRVELHLTGEEANGGRLLESISFQDPRIDLLEDELKVDLRGKLRPSSFYSIVLPPLSLSDRDGNNFTGLPQNHYIFGTGSELQVDNIDWAEGMWIGLGTFLVVVFCCVSGVAGYLLLQSGRQNAKVFAKRVRSTSKGVAKEGNAVYLEDVESDGFYAPPALRKEVQDPPPALRAAVGTAAGQGADHFRVAVAWDGELELARVSSKMSSTQATTTRLLPLASPRPGSLERSHSKRGEALLRSPRAPSASPRGSPPGSLERSLSKRGTEAKPSLRVSPRGSLERSPSKRLAEVKSPRGRGGTQLTLPEVSPRPRLEGPRSAADADAPTAPNVVAPVAPQLQGWERQGSKMSLSGSVKAPTAPTGAAPAAPQLQGWERQGSKMSLSGSFKAPTAPTGAAPAAPQLQGWERQGSKMSLSGSFKLPAAQPTLAASAAVSRSMSKARRPMSRGQQTPVRASQ
ncbi:unnamed protein product [Effrenium voratum]|uniref:Uncharacterized protein n=1 Tax=Effrenium voratum TaxID=2562239 RepID=A0AA36MTV2_9DINO|nr:unnamed protein product [Effrenium voratum]